MKTWPPVGQDGIRIGSSEIIRKRTQLESRSKEAKHFYMGSISEASQAYHYQRKRGVSALQARVPAPRRGAGFSRLQPAASALVPTLAVTKSPGQPTRQPGNLPSNKLLVEL